MLPFAAGIRTKRPLREGHRIGGLENFQRRNGGSADRRVAVVQPVPFRVAAMAAAEEREHDPTAAIAAMPGQRQRVDRAIGTAIDPFRRDMLEGLEHHIDQAKDGLRVAAHRLWRGDTEEAVLRNDEFNRLQDAGIRRHIGEDMFQRHIGGGDGRRARDIHRTGAGRARPAEINGQAVFRYRHVDGKGQHIIADTVIVQIVLDRDGAVRQRRKVVAHHAVSTLPEKFQSCGHIGLAIFVQQVGKALVAEVERVDLGIHIAIKRIGKARIG